MAKNGANTKTKEMLCILMSILIESVSSHPWLFPQTSGPRVFYTDVDPPLQNATNINIKTQSFRPEVPFGKLSPNSNSPVTSVVDSQASNNRYPAIQETGVSTSLNQFFPSAGTQIIASGSNYTRNNIGVTYSVPRVDLMKPYNLNYQALPVRGTGLLTDNGYYGSNFNKAFRGVGTQMTMPPPSTTLFEYGTKELQSSQQIQEQPNLENSNSTLPNDPAAMYYVNNPQSMGTSQTTSTNPGPIPEMLPESESEDSVSETRLFQSKPNANSVTTRIVNAERAVLNYNQSPVNDPLVDSYSPITQSLPISGMILTPTVRYVKQAEPRNVYESWQNSLDHHKLRYGAYIPRNINLYGGHDLHGAYDQNEDVLVLVPYQNKTYGFGYDIHSDDASSWRHETSDISGNRRGTYGYSDANGIYRRVEYTAGADGFHANVLTNEPGTDNQNPSHVRMTVV